MLTIGRVHTVDGAKVSCRGGGLLPGHTVIAGGRPRPRHLFSVSTMGVTRLWAAPDVRESAFKSGLHCHLHPTECQALCSCLWNLASAHLFMALVYGTCGERD
jgi:hypothetical protein